MLLLDIGNTGLKWAWVSNDFVLRQTGVVYYKGAINKNTLESLGFQGKVSTKVLVSNVAAKEGNVFIQEWSQKTFNQAPHFLTSERQKQGLKNGYKAPGTLGVDRWLSMLGALKTYGGPFCVIDAGSAITLDYVDKTGQHRGGKILPGSRQLQDLFPDKIISLKQQDPLLWGQTTEECLVTGTQKEMQTLMQVLINKLAEEKIKLVLTGGDAQSLAALCPEGTLVNSELVFKGMMLYLP